MISDKKPASRPTSSRNVRIVPILRKEPDIKKLVRVLISIAEKIELEQKQETA